MTAVNPSELSRRRLGRGLSALLGSTPPSPEEFEPTETLELRHVPVDAIERNPYQPRKDFDGESIAELSASIREHGVLQPLLVREIDQGFQLIAGERRWLAAKNAGLTRIPCRVLDIVDKAACEVALEENLKRKDLNDLEKAHAFRRYLDHFQCSIEELATQLSMHRSTVSNLLRLLELPEPVRNALQTGRISAGHARALLALADVADRLAVCGNIQADNLSVRETEKTVKRLNQARAASETAAAEPGEPAEVAADAYDADADAIDDGQILPVELQVIESWTDARTNHVRSLEEQLGGLLGVKVEIQLSSQNSGSIVIPFASNAEFERVLGRLRRHAA